ncbi:hypothetical protein JCM10450v2_000034 [Rhodotorula kratochvilovae]
MAPQNGFDGPYYGDNGRLDDGGRRWDEFRDRWDDRWYPSSRDRMIFIVVPSILLFLLLLALWWLFSRIAALRRRVLACEERALVHAAAVDALKEGWEAERESYYGAGWRHGRERERRKRRHGGHHYPPAIGYPGYY